MKKIEAKLQGYTASASVRPQSKKELEDQKKKEEEEAAANAFKEFVETFQEAPSKTSKVWVKAGTYDAGARKEDTSERGKLYVPQSRISHDPSPAEKAAALAKLLSSKAPANSIKKKDKKKSNLELFKEELRQIQEEREERHKYKHVLKTTLIPSDPINTLDIPAYMKDEILSFENGSYDNGDPNTTNLYLGNLNPKVTEQQLMEIFGRYGPLASIKIMWPRSDEEKARGRNCGFVAYMSRKDGERALKFLNGKEIMNYEMKMGWGKAVVIPPMPIYIPPILQMPSKPPPQTGLPFNAQPPPRLAREIPEVKPGESLPIEPDDQVKFNQILEQSVVKVVLPSERNVVVLIHRMVEFVIREGPMFEAMIMNKEINNPLFRFLFENQSPAHIYYRWKLFSLLQGDTPKQWRSEDFRMFKGGSVWRPPVVNQYTAGMPDDLIDVDGIRDTRGELSKSQRQRLEEMLRTITPNRSSVAAVMAWCVEHADASSEVAACIAESLSVKTTKPHKKIARFYLVSDILHNAAVKLYNVSSFRAQFQHRLLDIMRELHPMGQTDEGFRSRVSKVLRAWDHVTIYPTDFLLALNNAFLGLDEKASEPDQNTDDEDQGKDSTHNGSENSDEDSEGGGPLDGAALRRLAATSNRAVAPTLGVKKSVITDVDIDGVPLVEEDIDGVPMTEIGGNTPPPAPGFVPSKWESVHPDQVTAQAVTTVAWQRSPSPASPPTPPPPPDYATPNTTASLDDDERRATLREIEMKVMKYSDELESGKRTTRPGISREQQIQHYRHKLLKKLNSRERSLSPALSPPRKSRELVMSSSSSRKSSKKSRDSRESSPSPDRKRSRHRSRSRSRERRSSRRTPSPPPRKHKHKHKH